MKKSGQEGREEWEEVRMLLSQASDAAPCLRLLVVIEPQSQLAT